MLDGGNAVFNLIMASMVLGTVLILHICRQYLIGMWPILEAYQPIYIYVLFYGECRLCEIQNCDNLPGVTRRWCWSKTPSDCSARPQALSPERHQDLGDRVAKSKGSEEFYPKNTFDLQYFKFCYKMRKWPSNENYKGNTRWRLHWKLVKYIFVCFIQSNRNPNQ